MRKHHDFQIDFTEEEIKLVMEKDYKFEDFSKKDLLNVIASKTHELLPLILDSDIFQTIYIINDQEDYENESLNVPFNSEISIKLLENQNLKQKVFIKNLIDNGGFVFLGYLPYLDQCLSLIDEKKNLGNKKAFEFMLNLEKADLQKIIQKFPCYFVQGAQNIPKKGIENLLAIKGNNFIDRDILNIILNNYHKYEDQERKWLIEIFSEKYHSFTNYDVFEWISLHKEVYLQHYVDIEELHQFSYAETSIYERFFEEGYFVVKLAVPEHCISYLYENYERMSKKKPKIAAEFCEYALKNEKCEAFKVLLENPEKVLLKLSHLKDNFSKDLDMHLKLNIQILGIEIITDIEELLQSKKLDDLSDFYQKFEDGKISFAKIKDNNLSKKFTQQLMESSLDFKCSVCLKFNKDSTMFPICSHCICISCCHQYIEQKQNISFDMEKKDNLVIFNVKNISQFQKTINIECPLCRKNVFNQSSNKVILIRIFI